MVLVCVKALVNGRQPSLCLWMGLAGGPVFDKLWHLTASVAAWTLFGRLTHYCWSLAAAFLFVSPPFLLLFLTLHRMTVVQKQGGGCQTGHRWLQVWTVEGLGFPNTTSSAWFIHFTLQSKSSGYLDSGLNSQPSTTGSVPVRKLVCVGSSQSSQLVVNYSLPRWRM